MQNPAEAMGSYGGVLMLGHGRTDNLSPTQDTCSHAAETASARFSTLELSLRACVSNFPRRRALHPDLLPGSSKRSAMLMIRYLSWQRPFFEFVAPLGAQV
jgi:hypothetical protein